MTTELKQGDLVTMASLDGSELFAGIVFSAEEHLALVRVVDRDECAVYAIAQGTGRCVAIYPPETPLPVLVPFNCRASLADAEDAETARKFGHIEQATLTVTDKPAASVQGVR